MLVEKLNQCYKAYLLYNDFSTLYNRCGIEILDFSYGITGINITINTIELKIDQPFKNCFRFDKIYERVNQYPNKEIIIIYNNRKFKCKKLTFSAYINHFHAGEEIC